ncbi:MAG: NUDIX-like domain-containing protein, partial [Acetobacteraceae bacterium]
MEEIYCFAGNPLDRAAMRRQDAAWVAALRDDPLSLVLPFIDLKPLVRDASPPVLDWRPMAEWRERIAAGADLILLGVDDRRAYFALDAGSSEKAGEATRDVRALAAEIAGGEAAILGEARALLDWHARHRFCARCATPTLVASGG